MRSTAALFVLVVLLTACGAKHAADSKLDTPMPVRDTVFGDDVRALDKARTVEGTLQKDKERTDAAIDSASKNTSTDP